MNCKSRITIKHLNCIRTILILTAATAWWFSGPRARADALSASWTGGAGNWSDPAHWSTAPEIPDNGSNTFAVTIGVSNGPVTLDQNATVDSLSLTADLTNSGPFTLSVLGDFIWTGGTVSGGGSTTVGGRATLKNATLDGHTLVLNTTGRLESDLSLFNGARIENHGQFQFYRSSYSDLTGYSSTFVNDGVFLQDFADLNQIQSAWQQTTNGELDLGDSSTLRFLNNSTFTGAIALGGNGTLYLGSTTGSGNTTFTFATSSTITGGGAIDVEQMSGLNDEPTANFNGGLHLTNGTFLVSDGAANVRIGPDTELGDSLQELEVASVKLTGAASNTVFQMSQFDMGFQCVLWTESISNLDFGMLNSDGSGDIGAVDHLNLGTQTFTNGGPLTLSNTDLAVGQTGEVEGGSVITLANSSLIVSNGATLTIYGGSADAPTTIQGVTNVASSIKFRPLGMGTQPQEASDGYDVKAQREAEIDVYGDSDNRDLRARDAWSVDTAREFFGQFLAEGKRIAASIREEYNESGDVQVNDGSSLTVDRYKCTGAARTGLNNATLDLGIAPGQDAEVYGISLSLNNDGKFVTHNVVSGNPTQASIAGSAEFSAPTNMPASLVTLSSNKMTIGADARNHVYFHPGPPSQFGSLIAKSHGLTPHPLADPPTTGHLTVTADWVTFEPGLTSQFEIAGTAQGTNYDWLEVVGDMTVGGTLDLSIPNGFESFIQSTDTFAIITSSNAIAGTFTNVANGERLLTSNGTGSFAVNYGPNSAYDPSAVVLNDYQTPQVQLTTPAFQLNGDFGFSAAGPAGQNLVIDASADLKTWIPIATNPIPTNGVLPFLDNDASNYPLRFYRARKP